MVHMLNLSSSTSIECVVVRVMHKYETLLAFIYFLNLLTLFK